LNGINHSGDDGGSFFVIDYVQLNPAYPFPTRPSSDPVGKDDNDWPVGDGGGTNTTFVAPNGVINPLPGNPASPEVDQQADNDYYFAGLYNFTIPSVVTFYGDYTPVGEVLANEEAAERAFAAGDNEDRKSTRLNSSHVATPYA